MNELLPRPIPASSLLFLLLVIALSGCHRPFESGLEALAEGNYTQAEREARRGLATEPGGSEYHLLLADALVGQAKFKAAEPHAQKAFEDPELSGPAGRTYGKVLWELGRPVDAVEAWRTAREAVPDIVSDEDFVQAIETAIAMADSRNEFDASLALREELRTLRPQHELVSDAAIRKTREAHAEDLVRQGNYELAVETYAALRKEDPKETTYPFEQGRLLATLGQEDEAQRAFQDYIDLAPEEERVDRTVDVAQRAERLGSFAVALHFYARVLEVSADRPSVRRAKMHLKLAGLQLAAGRAEPGREHLRAYLEDMRELRGVPMSAEVYLTAAQVATQNRQHELALELLEEAVDKASPSWRATRMLAELHARRARSADVERVLRQYVERAEAPAAAYVRVGRWAAGRRNFELARFFLEKVVGDRDVAADVWLELARVYSALNLMDEVRRALDTYTKKAPDRRRALLDVASIYRAQRMYEEAEKALQRALKAERTDLLVVKQLEGLYREWGRPKMVHDVYADWAKARGNKAEDFQLIGERFYRQNEWDDALPYLIKAARAGEHEAWLQVADIYKRQRKDRDMKQALDQYLAVATDRPRALNAVWQRYRSSTWTHEGIPILEELVQLEPRNVLHYEQLSNLYFEQGRDVEAFELWKRYISLSQNPILSLETMARRFQRRDHHDWMLTFLHQILERESDPDPRIYRLLGDAYSELRKRPLQAGRVPDAHAIFTEQNKAKEYYEKYLAEAKPNKADLQNFAESMRQQGLWDVAAQAYEKLDLKGAIHAHQLLSYGIVLLNLGRTAEAEKIFSEYHETKNQSVDAARVIAEELFRARRYDAVVPYLRTMMDSGDENLLRNAFLRLSEVYRNWDRPERLAELAGEYLQKTQNPGEARRTVLTVLEAAGMWEEAVRQLERMTEVQGDEFGFELAVNLYRMNQKDRADDRFREYASNNVNPAEAWLRVARFYEDRGLVDEAASAYRRAMDAAPDNDAVVQEYARFEIMSGNIENGVRLFEKARQAVPHGRRGPIWQVQVQALLDAGRFADARAAARKALAVAYLDKDFFFRVLATGELSSGDAVRAQRMIDELKSTGLSLTTLVDLLVSHGYLEAVSDLIDDEITSGDYVLAGDLLLKHADVFTRLGGIERLMRSVQPLLERNTRSPQIPKALGEYLVREGHYEKGAMFLRQAVDEGDLSRRALLAYTYALLGHHAEAFEMLQAHLATSGEFQRRELLRVFAYQYEILGERERFRGLVEHLARDERFAADALPLLLQYLVQDGEITRAIALVEQTWGSDTLNPEAAAEIKIDDRIDLAADILVAGVEELATEGFVREAVQLLDDAPRFIRENEQVRDLRLRMAAFTDALDAEQEFRFALDALGGSNLEARQRLRVAQLASLAGHFDRARTIAEPELSSADFDVASDALRLLIANARLSNALDAVDGYIETYMQHSADRASARRVVATALVEASLDERAVAVTREQAKRIPTEQNLRDALDTAQKAGDEAALREANAKFWTVSLQPMDEAGFRARNWLLRQDTKLTMPLFERIAAARPEGLTNRQYQAINYYRTGKPEKARELLLGYLDSVEWEGQAVETVLSFLDRYKLHGDMARLIGPRLEEQQQTVQSLHLLGLANLSLGFQDEGLRLLDRALAASHDPAHAAAEAANELLVRGKYEYALRYAQRSIDARPARREAYLYRGMARLALGDVEGAQEDLDSSLEDGLGRSFALYRIGKLALRTNKPELARKYLRQLLLSTPPEGFDPQQPARLALQAFVDADQGEEGVKFLEELRPQVAAGKGVSGTFLTPSLSGLYEAAGQNERAYSVYQHAIRRLELQQPFSEQLATYRNNLAYTFSTTNQHIDQGVDLVLQAIANARGRSSSYIDTLGWLYYRAGDLAAAEAEIRRALRSSTRGAEELIELYSHLADIREARGYHAEAVWIRLFVQSLEHPE